MLIDVHTHLDQHDPEELPGIIERAAARGVAAIVVAGVTVASSSRCVEIAQTNRGIFAGVGVHPSDLEGDLTPNDLDDLDRLAASEKVVVMSEIGLDYLPHSPDRQMQERALRAQIDVARRHELPIVFHVREAERDAVRVLADERAGDLGGAAHYFQGGREYARSVLDMGFHLSLAKPLLRLPELQDVAAWAPIDRIVLETDSYPQPFKRKREKWTEPRDLPLVAAKLAEIKGLDVEEIERITTRNALAMIGTRSAPIGALLAGALS